jgi:EAL domain-containing protein (putative c-di-GMP-specific phosphodiesterase class I)
VPIGQWVIEEACRQAVVWQALRPTATPLVMDVNLSARQLQQPDIAAIVASALRESGLDPGALRLEITESTAMQDAEATIHTLEALHDLGVLLAIDDFGTGYSSLAYLRRFPIDTLKIDQSFLVELEHEQSASDIVRAVTHLAAALGMDVTAEGIETAGQLARIIDIDCDRGQGYYFARPLPPDAFEAILRRGALAAPGDSAAAGQ